MLSCHGKTRVRGGYLETRNRILLLVVKAYDIQESMIVQHIQD